MNVYSEIIICSEVGAVNAKLDVKWSENDVWM